MSKTTVPNRVKTVRTVLGFDPDTRATGWAFLEEGKILAIGVIALKDKTLSGQRAATVMSGAVNDAILHMPYVDLAVVEGQQVYRNGKADANNLLKLAAVSGACLGALMFKAARVEFPVPRTWKGQRPKGAHQAWILDQFEGWEYEFNGAKHPPTIIRVPDNVDIVGGSIPNARWKEVVDAMGLALWGYEKA